MDRRLMAVGMMVAALVMAGCDDGGGGGGGGAGGDGQGGGGGQGATGGGGGGGGGSATCGGATCGPNEFCDWSDDRCGATESGAGTCKPLPDACDDVYMPMCGCDGTVHSNACEANASGEDINTAGGCTPPDGTFACGAQFCASGQQYCQKTGSDVGGEPDFHQCLDLPPGCMDCACLASVTCGDMCAQAADGSLQVTCLGG